MGIKASLPVAKWSAQWQQQPTSEEGAIVKKDWWNMWDKEEIPPVKTSFRATIQRFRRKKVWIKCYYDVHLYIRGRWLGQHHFDGREAWAVEFSI